MMTCPWSSRQPAADLQTPSRVLAAVNRPFSDSRAADLVLVLGARPTAAIAVLEVEVAGVAVELRLLGASHQVLVDGTSETVACELPGLPGGLPAERSTPAAHGRTHVFRSTVEPLDVSALRAVVDAAARDPFALAGVFPGDDGAATALRVRPGPDGGVRWRTWHGYPQTGELVMTWSELA